MTASNLGVASELRFNHFPALCTMKPFSHSLLILLTVALFEVSSFAVPAAVLAQAAGPEEKKSPRFRSVDDYLAKQDATKAKTLRSILDFILAEFPELEAKIAWNVPTIHLKGKYVVGLSAPTNQPLLYPF